jgi:chromosome segregation ATPase
MTAATGKIKRFEKAETDIAVLQIQVSNLDEKVDELKSEIKDLHECLDRNMDETKVILKEFQNSTQSQHDELAEKLSSLEKIKWMLMGAAAILGATGLEAVQMFLSA